MNGNGGNSIWRAVYCHSCEKNPGLSVELFQSLGHPPALIDLLITLPMN